MKKNSKILISTLYPKGRGGVLTLIQLVTEILLKSGYDVDIAYYVPFSVEPNMSRTLLRPLTSRVKQVEQHFFDGTRCYGIGATFPEFEHTNYRLNNFWKKLIDNADICMVISGNILPALPFQMANKPYLSWIASSYLEDRVDRAKCFPWYRKIFDSLFVKPVALYYESKLLKHGRHLAISKYTKSELLKYGCPRDNVSILPIPIDQNIFFADRGKVVPWNIGFVGRLLDPRKNIQLLISAFSKILRIHSKARLTLVGSELSEHQYEQIERLNISWDRIFIYKRLSLLQLTEKLREIDVFLVPSKQEGLCISALEAMASGCPVVSTKCGGPEDYVLNDYNGYLVDHTCHELAEAISSICKDREKREMMSIASVTTISEKYARKDVESKLLAQLNN